MDDVVTIGRTMLGAASHVRAAFPEAEIRAFALIHAFGLTPEIEKIEIPYVGSLRRSGRYIRHEPPQ